MTLNKFRGWRQRKFGGISCRDGTCGGGWWVGRPSRGAGVGMPPQRPTITLGPTHTLSWVTLTLSHTQLWVTDTLIHTLHGSNTHCFLVTEAYTHTLLRVKLTHAYCLSYPSWLSESCVSSCLTSLQVVSNKAGGQWQFSKCSKIYQVWYARMVLASE